MRAKGWKDVLKNFYNLVSNISWNLTFWKTTNTSKIMHILGIQSRGGTKRILAYWILRVLEYVALTSLEIYRSWAIKLACKIDDLKIIKDNLWNCGSLCPKWKDENNNKCLRLACPKAHAKDLIKLMDDEEEQE